MKYKYKEPETGEEVKTRQQKTKTRLNFFLESKMYIRTQTRKKDKKEKKLFTSR